MIRMPFFLVLMPEKEHFRGLARVRGISGHSQKIER